MNPFATHMPVLLACLEHTSGPVLELGSGWFSTPIVSAFATDRLVAAGDYDAAVIEGALQEGFTTVRDAGGLEPAWAQAVASGTLAGPRILPAGSPISQTGGHADDRQRHEALHHGHTIPGLVAGFEIADGVDEVRRAAREQLRRGASQVKLMASGGVISPTDPLESLQLSVAEIRVAVEVARSWGTYVMAHCHTTPSVEMALDAGVRSIEHGSILEPATAARIADFCAFARAMCRGIGLPAGFRRWIRLVSIRFASQVPAQDNLLGRRRIRGRDRGPVYARLLCPDRERHGPQHQQHRRCREYLRNFGARYPVKHGL